MAKGASTDRTSTPDETGGTTPSDLSHGTGQTRVLAGVLEDGLKELRADVREVKAYRHSDFRILAGMIATCFLVLAGMVVTGYFKLDDRIALTTGKADDRITTLTTTSTRIDTKLEDLLQRIPPAVTPVPAPRR